MPSNTLKKPSIAPFDVGEQGFARVTLNCMSANTLSRAMASARAEYSDPLSR